MHAARASTADRLRSRLALPTALAAALTLGLLTTATAGAQEWRKLPDMPVEKWERGGVVRDLDEWARGGAEWTAAAPMPEPRNQFSCVTFEGRIYAIGGQFHHDSEQLDQARVDVYDPATDTWTSGPPLPKGHSHAEGSTFVHDRRIYMAGGHTTAPGESKQVDPDILALSPGGDWEVIGKLPMPLSSPAAAIIDGRFYVAGGSPGRSAVQADMWVGELP